eukprot:TRINITY_DN1308_c0_g2_i3.p1 TRINITY_DN1308_c0_g2~~TRINITY_DN1308_c0_g2_i3.p1  ORF type:complete len:1446 (+),score=433.72 TRINITY_DN1308_c0_g2_i3:268-4605(+)
MSTFAEKRAKHASDAGRPSQYRTQKRQESDASASLKKNPHYFRDKLFEKLRPYQREVQMEACDRNALLVMPTGTGKTIVSFCIAEHVRGNYIKQGTPKPVLFLTLTRALAFQQYRACKKLLTSFYMPETQLINLLDKNCDLSQARKGEVSYVFGITANYLEQLKLGNTKLSHFCLVIMDEAHNVTKKSPGTTIMQNFYQQEEVNRPFILGLTATPVFHVADLEANVSKLCSMLNADLVTVKNTENIKEMEDYEARGAPFFEIVNHTSNERDVLQLVNYTATILKNKMLFCADNEEDTSKSTMQKVRAYVGNPSPSHEEPLLNEMKNTAHAENCQDIEALANLLIILNEVKQLTSTIGVMAASEHWSKQIEELRVKGRVLITQELEDTITSVAMTLQSLHEVRGSKEVALTQLIRQESERSGLGMRVLVFVQTKAECMRLSERLRNVFTQTDDPLLQGVGVDFGFRDNTANIPKFEEGKVKVIICTTLYEEGIDIPTCSLVIRYFMNNFNIVALNQCRGRARRSEAKFVLMVESEETEDKARKNLDYSGIMKMLRDLQSRKQEAHRCEWWRNASYAANLVSVFAEKNKQNYMVPMPEISYVDEGEQGVIAVTTYYVRDQPFKFQGRGPNTKVAKEKLLYAICGYLWEQKLIDQTGYYNRNTQRLPEKIYETQQTAVVSHVDLDVNVVFENKLSWPFRKTPIEKLSELCSRTYDLECEDKMEGGGWLCKIYLHRSGSKATKVSPFCARNKYGQGWANFEQARHNSAIAALVERYNFSFVEEEPPVELRDKVPETFADRAGKMEVVTYYNAQGIMVSKFGAAGEGKPFFPRNPVPRNGGNARFTFTTNGISEPRPPIGPSSIRPSVDDAIVGSPVGSQPQEPSNGTSHLYQHSPLYLPDRQPSPAYLQAQAPLEQRQAPPFTHQAQQQQQQQQYLGNHNQQQQQYPGSAYQQEQRQQSLQARSVYPYNMQHLFQNQNGQPGELRQQQPQAPAQHQQGQQYLQPQAPAQHQQELRQEQRPQAPAQHQHELRQEQQRAPGQQQQGQLRSVPQQQHQETHLQLQQVLQPQFQNQQPMQYGQRDLQAQPQYTQPQSREQPLNQSDQQSQPAAQYQQLQPLQYQQQQYHASQQQRAPQYQQPHLQQPQPQPQQPQPQEPSWPQAQAPSNHIQQQQQRNQQQPEGMQQQQRRDQQSPWAQPQPQPQPHQPLHSQPQEPSWPQALTQAQAHSNHVQQQQHQHDQQQPEGMQQQQRDQQSPWAQPQPQALNNYIQQQHQRDQQQAPWPQAPSNHIQQLHQRDQQRVGVTWAQPPSQPEGIQQQNSAAPERADTKGRSLAALRSAKDAAVGREDYEEAGRLKKEVEALEGDYKRELQAAVAREDYETAAELQRALGGEQQATASLEKQNGAPCHDVRPFVNGTGHSENGHVGSSHFQMQGGLQNGRHAPDHEAYDNF